MPGLELTLTGYDNMTADKGFLPLLIDLTGRKIVIFGGGSVGERKSSLFSRYADVTVISSMFTSALEELSLGNKVKLLEADIGSLSDDDINELIHGSFLVIPATNDPLLNRKIMDVAREKDILVNQVDGIGDVVVPSVIQRGDLTIGISTLGSSPALSKYTRMKIEDVITPEYGDMIRLQDDVRKFLKENVGDQKTRKAILWKVLENGSVWSLLSQSYEKAYNVAYDIVLEQIDKTQQ